MALPPPWVSDLLVGFSVMCTGRAFCSPGRTWIGYRVAPRVIAILSLPERFRQWLWSLGSNPVFSGGSVGRLPIAVLMGHYKRLVLLKSMLSLSSAVWLPSLQNRLSSNLSCSFCGPRRFCLSAVAPGSTLVCLHVCCWCLRGQVTDYGAGRLGPSPPLEKTQRSSF